MRHASRLLAALATTLFVATPSLALADDASSGSVQPLMNKDVIGAPGKEVALITVSYLPAGTTLPHRHDAQVFVYVLKGTVSMQIAGSPKVTLHAGDTFYEGPDDVHLVSANASTSAPAKLLVFVIKNRGSPLVLPAEKSQ